MCEQRVEARNRTRDGWMTTLGVCRRSLPWTLLAKPKVGFVDAESDFGFSLFEEAVSERLEGGEIEFGSCLQLRDNEDDVGNWHVRPEGGEKERKKRKKRIRATKIKFKIRTFL